MTCLNRHMLTATLIPPTYTSHVTDLLKLGGELRLGHLEVRVLVHVRAVHCGVGWRHGGVSWWVVGRAGCVYVSDTRARVSRTVGRVDDALHDVAVGHIDGVVDGAAEVAAPPEGVVRGLVRLLVELHALHEVQPLPLRELVVDVLDGPLVELVEVRRRVLDALFGGGIGDGGWRGLVDPCAGKWVDEWLIRSETHPGGDAVGLVLDVQREDVPLVGVGLHDVAPRLQDVRLGVPLVVLLWF